MWLIHKSKGKGWPTRFQRSKKGFVFWSLISGILLTQTWQRDCLRNTKSFSFIIFLSSSLLFFAGFVNVTSNIDEEDKKWICKNFPSFLHNFTGHKGELWSANQTSPLLHFQICNNQSQLYFIEWKKCSIKKRERHHLSTHNQLISTKYWNCFTIPGRFGQEEHWLDTISNRKLLFNQRWKFVLMIHLQKTSCLQVLAKNLCPHQRAKGLPIRWEKPIVILRRERIKDF